MRDARGRGVRHHVTHELALPDGRVLWTRISRPVNTTTYGTGLWSTILRQQLDVTEDEFWACVTDKRRPDRGQPPAQLPETARPAQLVWQLVHTAGLAEADVAQMTLDQAIAAMTAHWSKPSNW